MKPVFTVETCLGSMEYSILLKMEKRRHGWFHALVPEETPKKHDCCCYVKLVESFQGALFYSSATPGSRMALAEQ